MQKKWMFLWGVLCIAQSITAQITFSGKVTDVYGKPLSFVSVVLEQKQQGLGFTATNELGQFRFALIADSSARINGGGGLAWVMSCSSKRGI